MRLFVGRLGSFVSLALALAGCGHTAIRVDGVMRESSEMRPLQNVPGDAYRQVKFFTPEEMFSYLDGLDAKVSPGRTPPPDPSELLTAKEVEELLRIDVKTVYSYVQRGLIPYVRIQSNVRFLRSEILKWMEERQYKPGSRPAKR